VSLTSSHLSLLFVYGTLRRGEGRHDLLEELRAAWVGRGTVGGELFDLGPFPGAVKSDPLSPRQIIGEVYRLADPPRALQALDEYECLASGEPNLYRREITTVVLSGGERLEAWIYWLDQPPPVRRRIESGDYADRRVR